MLNLYINLLYIKSNFFHNSLCLLLMLFIGNGGWSWFVIATSKQLIGLWWCLGTAGEEPDGLSV